MIKISSIILVLNIFLFSGIANAEKAGADAQDGINGTISAPVKDAKDTAQLEKDSLHLEKQATSNERSAGAEKSDQKESTNLPADSTFGEAERDARKEMIAKERAAREMDARVRAARAEAAREMAARVRAAREEAAREMDARVRAARAEAAREMAAREKERAARERYYRERMVRY